MIVHDLIHFRFPSGFPLRVRVPGRFLMSSALHKASRLVTVSQYCRDDIIRWKPSTADKLSVITPGVSELFRPLEEGEREDARHRWGRSGYGQRRRPSSAQRGQNLKAGRLWASGFSWNRTAEELLRVLRAAA